MKKSTPEDLLKGWQGQRKGERKKRFKKIKSQFSDDQKKIDSGSSKASVDQSSKKDSKPKVEQVAAGYVGGILSSGVKREYLKQFGKLNSEDAEKKSKFFDDAVKRITKKTVEAMEKGESIEGGDFIKNILSKANVYSKINKALQEVQQQSVQGPGPAKNNQKTKKPFKTKTNNMAFNAEKNPGIQPKDAAQGGIKEDPAEKEKRKKENEEKNSEIFKDPWSDKDKADFDEAWKKEEEKRNKKAVNDTETSELVDDPEAAAMGGFDRGTAAAAQTVESSASSNAEGNETTQSSVSTEEADKATERMENLKNDLENARRGYTSIHRKSEGLVSKIKGVFGHIDTDTDNDVAEMKGKYRDALENYRNAMLENIDSLPEAEQRAVMEQLRDFDLREKVSLYEDRVTAKAESIGEKFGGELGKKIGELSYKAIQGYKKLPMKYKIAASGFLLVGGMATGGTGFAAGIFGSAVFAKRALGAGVAGTGMTGWTEARAHKKEEAGINKDMEKFKEMSLDEQKALLQGFDDNSFKKLEKEFHGKIAGRSRRVMYGIGAAAGVMALGGSKFFGAGAESIQDSGATDAINSNASEVSRVAAGGVTHLESSQDLADETIKAATGETVAETGTVNSELLREEASKAFKTPEFSGDLPETVNIDNVDAVDQEVAMAQMDASAEADNPLNQGFNGIEMSGDSGTLTVESGSNIKDTIAAFLKENSYKLTEGGMGWDPDSGRWADVDEWANDRAVGLAAEYAEANPGVDINIIQPGTELKLNLSNPSDVRLDIDFEGGPRIIPEGVKETVELSDGGLYESAVTGEIVNKLGLTQEQFAQISENKVSDITDIAVGKNPADWTQLERTLMELSRPGGVVVADKTVVEFLDVAQKSDLLEEVINNSTGGATGGAVEAASENMFDDQDSEAFRDRILGSDETRDVLLKDVADQIREITGPSLAKQMGETKLEVILNTEPVNTESGLQEIQGSVNAVIDRAKDSLGTDTSGRLVGEPRAEATMQSYFTRIFLEAERQGKVKDIFPSSNSEGYVMPKLPEDF